MPKLTIDSVDIVYDDSGRGPAVILLHGYPFNRSLWKAQVDALSDTYRVVTPDLRGHGESSVGPVTMERLARDVAALMDHLLIPKAIIGGLSMGGYAALAFYRQFPERVCGLVLADTRSSSDSAEARNTRAEQSKQILAEGMSSVVDSMLPKLLHPETVSKRPELVKSLRDMMLQTKPRGAAAALDGMAARNDQTPLLKNISVPTLIIVGAEDAITPVSDAVQMNGKISGSTLVVIQRAGHVSNLERPEEFNKAILEFLQQPGLAK